MPRSGGKAVNGVDVFHLVYTCLIVSLTISLLVVREKKWAQFETFLNEEEL